MDSRGRSWMKSVVWRVTGIVILGGIAYVITGNMGQTAWITIVFHGLRLVLYYVHERAWERVQWGRLVDPLVAQYGECIDVMRRVVEEKASSCDRDTDCCGWCKIKMASNRCRVENAKHALALANKVKPETK